MSRANFRPAINPDTHPAAFLRDRMEDATRTARFLIFMEIDPTAAGLAARSAAHDARALCRSELINATRAHRDAVIFATPGDIKTALFTPDLRAIVTEPTDNQDTTPRDDRPTLAEQAEAAASLSSLRR